MLRTGSHLSLADDDGLSREEAARQFHLSDIAAAAQRAADDPLLTPAEREAWEVWATNVRRRLR